MNPLLEQRDRWLGIIADLQREEELRKRLTETSGLVRTCERDCQKSEMDLANCKSTLQQRRAELEKAQTAWLWRASKTAAASLALRAAEREIENAEGLVTSLEHEIDQLNQALVQLQVSMRRQQSVCEKHPARSVIEEKLSRIALKLTPLEQEFGSIQDELSQLEQEVIREARAIFPLLPR